MYHEHFSLREEPFGVSPDHRFFLQTEQHREALATLYYALVQRRGLVLLLGRAGLGKTSVLVKLMQLLEGLAETAYLPHPHFNAETVFETVLVSLGLPSTKSAARNYQMFYEYLIQMHGSGKRCVIIFDEAQRLSADTLEAIRILSNFETPWDKLVQIVLAGQPRLAETLVRPECEQLLQRCSIIARLKPLARRNVDEYIAHRLKTAGAPENFFSEEALAAIAVASNGIPRNINTICFNSLSVAYALRNATVGAEHVAEAVHDLDITADARWQADLGPKRDSIPMRAGA